MSTKAIRDVSAAVLGGTLALIGLNAHAETHLEGTYLAPEGGLILHKMVFKAPNIVTLTMMTQTMRARKGVQGLAKVCKA